MSNQPQTPDYTAFYLEAAERCARLADQTPGDPIPYLRESNEYAEKARRNRGNR